MRNRFLAVGLTLCTATVALADGPAHLASMVPGLLTMRDQMHDTTAMAGRWIDATHLIAGADDPEPVLRNAVESYCLPEHPATRDISAVSPLSMEVAMFRQATGAFVTRLEWVGGHRYARQFDMDAFMQFFGVDEIGADGEIPRLLMDMRLNAGRAMSGHVDVFMPAPDVLIFSQEGVVTLLLRCP